LGASGAHRRARAAAVKGVRRRGGGGSAAVAGALSAGAFVAGRHLLWGLSDAGKRRRVGERVFGPV